MKVLFKYISKLFAGPFLIGLGGFIVFVSVEILYQLSNIIVRHRVGFSKLLLLIYYYLPYFVSMGIPVGVLLSIFWIVTELSERREIMALQVHGITLKTLIIPFLFWALVLSGITFILNDDIVPKFQEKADEVLAKYVYKRAGIEKFIMENVLTKYENQYLYIRKYDEKRGVIEGVVLFRYDKDGEEIITAKEVVKEGNTWYLMDGRYYRLTKDGFLKFDSSFKKLKLDIGQEIEKYLKIKRPKTMTGKELKEKIRVLRKLGANVSPWLVELHTRYANALAPVIIVLVGLSLSLTFNLRSKSWGVILTFILVVLYQGSGAWLSAMGRENMVDPILSVWATNMVFGMVGIILFSMIGTPLEYRIREFITRFAIMMIIFSSTMVFSENIDIKSETSVFSDEYATFTGNVILKYKDITIESKSMVAYFEDGKVEKVVCENAVLRRKEGVLRSERMVFYPDSEVSELFIVSGDFKVEGKRLNLESGRAVYRKDEFSLSENVEITSKDFKLKGGFAKVFLEDEKVKLLVSPFPVTFEGKGKKGEYSIKADWIEIDVEKEVARLGSFKGYFTYEENKKLHKIYDFGNGISIDGEGLVIEGGGITTCDRDPPHYSISSPRVIYRYGYYVIAENAVVSIMGFPVFYFPYFFMTLYGGMSFNMGFSVTADGISSVSYSFEQKSENLSMKLSMGSSEGKDSYSVSLSSKTKFGNLSISNSFVVSDGALSGEKTVLKLEKIPIFTSPKITITDDTNHSRQIYSLSGSAKIGKGKIVYVLSRTHTGSKTDYVIPSVKLSKLVFPILGGKFSIGNFTHKTSLSFTEGNIFDNLDRAISTGKISISYSRGLYKTLGTSVSVGFGSDYSFEGATPTNYKLSFSGNFVPFSKKFKLFDFKNEIVQKISGGITLTKDSTPLKNVSESMVFKSSGSLGPFSLSVDYSRSNLWRGYESLEEVGDKKKHLVKFNSRLNVSLLKTKISVSSSYDFLKDASEALSDPVIKTETAFSLLGIGFKLNTSTVYKYREDEKIQKTSLKGSLSYAISDWKLGASFDTYYDYTLDEKNFGPFKVNLTQAYKGKKFTNTVSFTYNPYEDVHVRSITDTFKFSKLDIWVFRSIKLSGQAKFVRRDDEMRFDYMKAKGTFSIGKVGNSVSLTLRKPGDDLTFSLGYSVKNMDPTFKLSASGGFYEDGFKLSRFDLSLTKSLHCWTMSISTSLSYDGELRVSKFAVNFKLKEFPQKGVSLDGKTGKIDLNFF